MSHQEHKVAESSLMAYISLDNSVTISNGKPVLGERCKTVLKAYSKHPHWTDFMIAKLALGFDDPNKVRPRRKDLEDDGLVAFDGKRTCDVTHETANAYVVTTKGADLLQTIYAQERATQFLKEHKTHG
jgi:predicted transcriptional regulator